MIKTGIHFICSFTITGMDIRGMIITKNEYAIAINAIPARIIIIV